MPPTSWEDLWKPEYKGRVGITGMASSLGTAFMVEIAKLNGGSETNVEPAFAARLTPAFLAQIRAALVTEGTPTDWVYVGSQTAEGVTVSSYWIRLSGVPHIWSIAVTAAGKIAGSQLQ